MHTFIKYLLAAIIWFAGQATLFILAALLGLPSFVGSIAATAWAFWFCWEAFPRYAGWFDRTFSA